MLPSHYKSRRLEKKTTLEPHKALLPLLGTRSLVLVGMMGVGKTTIGRRIAQLTALPFFDCDKEIEDISKRTVTEIFQDYGEEEFRRLENRVLNRLLSTGPAVVATGGGAYIQQANRLAIQKNGLAIWLKADLETLMQRVLRQKTRPLLEKSDPYGVMQRLLQERESFYAHAPIVVHNQNHKKMHMARKVLACAYQFLKYEGKSGAFKNI